MNDLGYIIVVGIAFAVSVIASYYIGYRIGRADGYDAGVNHRGSEHG